MSRFTDSLEQLCSSLEQMASCGIAVGTGVHVG